MGRTVRITVLVENTAQDQGLLAEHGLAFWIDTGSHRVLFDTGQGIVVSANAFKLHVPLREVDAVVLSHGHYDHTGGLPEALRFSRSPPCYYHPAALEPKYARNKNGTAREIGIPFPSQEKLRLNANGRVSTEGPTEVVHGLMATGPIPRATDFENTGGPFFLDERFERPDPLVDDQALFFDSEDGTVVLLGCAHSGVVNTLHYVRQLTGNRPVAALLGGMHLIEASQERLHRTIEEFRSFNVRRIAPAHCTGMSATAALWNAFPGRCVSCHVGDCFRFDLR